MWNALLNIVMTVSLLGNTLPNLICSFQTSHPQKIKFHQNKCLENNSRGANKYKTKRQLGLSLFITDGFNMKQEVGIFLIFFLSLKTGSGSFSRRSSHPVNVLGYPLQSCSTNPMTGWFRDGYCRTDRFDFGLHTVCATMTQEVIIL